MEVRVDPVVTAGLFAQLARDLHQQEGGKIAERVQQFALDLFGCSQVNLFEITAARGLASEPAQAALASRDVVVVPDTLTEDRWPVWAEATAKAGLRSALILPLFGDRSELGILELSSVHPYQFEAADVLTALALAGHASLAMQASRLEATLHQAIASHQLSGQATGMLMERYGIDAGQAFAVLRRYSQDNNIKLRDVSRQLLDTGQLPGGKNTSVA
ncbi:GAF and ANTAR domain-containing protein [Kribbella sp. NPDC056861]|uniref:ANTAR domain-containing response regulator n=1 Tax=Kribbella sp. NPDC056861 TaxID=3154857 RepID=UPI00341C78C6